MNLSREVIMLPRNEGCLPGVIKEIDCFFWGGSCLQFYFLCWAKLNSTLHQLDAQAAGLKKRPMNGSSSADWFGENGCEAEMIARLVFASEVTGEI
ncbi:hypothetical protein [Rufibacter ruber]|uniref:hypothetical protein n=1 Tax=Rufibacter ruber TaxID=1783499 RepID=UPI0008377BA5|nr:hypothetical protein [Rufibacter ruber]